MTASTIRDAIQAFAQSLNASSIFPASLLVLVNAFFVFPIFVDFDLTSVQAFTVVLAASLLVSYLLYAFNYPIIRVLEGYKLQRFSFMQSRLELFQAKRKRLMEELSTVDDEIASLLNRTKEGFDEAGRPNLCQEQLRKWESLSHRSAQIQRELDIYFPTTEASVLPTKLGNVIRAFESYSASRYGMDSIALWPRVVPILKENDYLNFVVQEKAVFDFLLNSLLVVLVLGIELMYVAAYLGKFGMLLTVLLVSLVAWLVLYEGLIVAARQWGTTVRVAFDLYRYIMHERLKLRTNSSFEDDYRMWQEVSRFLLFRSDQADFQGFEPSASIIRYGQ